MEQIEQATIADIPQLCDLLTILFTQEADFYADRDKQMRGLRLIIESPERGRIFVARIAGQVVGMVSLLFTISTAEGAPACWLEDMVIRPEHRDNHLGSHLLQQAVSFAKAQGFARITLLTDRTNEQAIRFYQRHGFRPSEMTPLRLQL
jgi:ribosomal protein S18 acetylase RimI-like enzyme